MSKSATEQYQIKKKRKLNNKNKNKQSSNNNTGQVRNAKKISKIIRIKHKNNINYFNKHKELNRNVNTCGGLLVKQLTLTQLILQQRQHQRQQHTQTHKQHQQFKLATLNNAAISRPLLKTFPNTGLAIESDAAVTRRWALCNEFAENSSDDVCTQRLCCISRRTRSARENISGSTQQDIVLSRSECLVTSQMPLSQSFSGAAKRNANSPALPRQVEAAKRSKSAKVDHFTRMNPQQQLIARPRHTSLSARNSNHKISGGKSSKFCGARSVYRQTTAAVTPTAPLLSPSAGGYASATALTQSNNLQFYYSLAESLTRYGNLMEAFDVYAFIASEQLDSCIPLDRLNTFANSLITYIRKLSTAERLSGNFEEELNQSASAVAGVNSALNNVANWDDTVGVVSCSISATTPVAVPVPDAVVGAELADMRSPTRELLRVPSPTQNEDYDPLLCPLCNDILRCPVTTNCGHTFCRQCCETITQCNICHVKFHVGPLDDLGQEVSGSARNYATPSITLLSTATSTSSSSSSAASVLGAGVSSDASAPAAPSPIAPLSSASALHSNSAPFSNISAVSSCANSAGPTDSGNQFLIRCWQARDMSAAPPTTVTTATIASTTATATTTMASSGTGAGVGTVDGVAGATTKINSSPTNMKFMSDVLVRRLVEKWWGADLQAKKNNETAASYMHMNLLDDALKFCNASLEKSPTNFKSLLLRAEVLRKLNHFQSSLADADNALKTRYTSSKAHYLRALALCDLGRCDEALYDNCLAISFDKDTLLTSSELFQHDLAKNLQKLLAQAPKSKSFPHRVFSSATAAVAAFPYKLLAGEQHLRGGKQLTLLSNANGDHLNSFDEEFIPRCDNKCDIIADVDYLTPFDGNGRVISERGGIDYQDDDIRGSAASISEYITSIGSTLMDKRLSLYAGMEKYLDIELRRQTSRKHFRRKWTQKETEFIPAFGTTLEEVHYGALFRNVLERVQQELRRLKKIDLINGMSQKSLLQIPAALVDVSDFDCVLCCRTFWKPVVTPCGHTYCRVCLDRCMDYTSSCPLCMSPLVEPNVNTMYQQGASSPVPFSVTKRPVTKFLEAAMKRLIPEIYEKRFRQEIDSEPSVPLFICTTAFPYVPCPLFVYEPRYRLMVRRAVESGEKQFGIVQPNSGKSRYFDIGTMLDIRDCVLLGDGCSILSTVGCRRFKILARNEKDGYETAKVEYIYDETIPDEMVKAVNQMHTVVLAKAIEWFDSLSTGLKQEILQSLGEMPAVEKNWETISDGPAWAWWIIALLPLNQQLKVDILATTSLEKRLRAIEKTLDYMSGTLRRSQQHDCSVVVAQQKQQQQQQQLQEEQQEDCDIDLPQSDECCPRTTATNALRTVNGDQHDHHHHHHHHHDHHHHHHQASGREQELLL